MRGKKSVCHFRVQFMHFKRFRYADNNFSVHSYLKASINSMASNTVENVLLLVYSHLSLSSVSVNSGNPSCKSSFNTAFAFFTASGYRSAYDVIKKIDGSIGQKSNPSPKAGEEMIQSEEVLEQDKDR